MPTKLLADLLPEVRVDTSVPTSFGQWHRSQGGSPVLPDPTQQALLDRLYNSTMAETYIDESGYRIMFTAAYGKKQLDDTIQLHNPEVCYAAQGFNVSGLKAVSVNLGDRGLRAHQLVAVAPNRPEVVTYWIVVGERVANTRTEQKKASLRYGFQGYIPDGLLMRVSSIDSDHERAVAMQANFIAQLYEAIPVEVRTRYFGIQ